MTADAAAKRLVQEKGISEEFGAREIERVIQNEIKPLFADEILFGSLKQGGACRLTAEHGMFRLCVHEQQPDSRIVKKKELKIEIG